MLVTNLKIFPRPFMSGATSIPANLTRVRGHLANISSSPARLVAVSKLKPVADIRSAYEAGQRHFGENYVSEVVEKCTQLPGDIRWHMIGHLQSNKVNRLISACPNLYMIETIDSMKLADKVNMAMKNNRPSDRLNVLVEVKTSAEDTKAGLAAEEVPSLVEHIMDKCPHLCFSGLMTIADPSNPGECFKKLYDLKQSLETKGVTVEILSMGMSGDYEEAIRSGSNQVRIGSSIFGSRQ